MSPFLLFVAVLGCSDKDTETVDSSAFDCDTLGIDVPSPRGELPGTWDPAGERLVIFGGDQGAAIDCSTQTDMVGETWLFYPACGAFQQVEGDGPPARARHAMVLDAARNRVLVHGGRFRDGTSGNYTLFDDLWALDLGTLTWTELDAPDGPSARVNQVMVVTGDRLLLQGGNTSKSGASYSPQGDLWSLDLESLEWEEITFDDGPSDRLFHGGAISEDGETLYIHAGGDASAFTGPFLQDLWSLDLSSGVWTELHDGTGRAPEGRLGGGLHFDGANERLLMVGGHDDGNLGNTNELWSFELADGSWDKQEDGDEYNAAPNGYCDFPEDFVVADLEAPERRYLHASAFSGDALYIFGGKTDCGVINDVWSWSDGGWEEHSPATAGEICSRAFAECESLCF